MKNAGRIKHCEIIIIIIVHNASIAGYSATYDKIVNVMNAYDEDELKNMDPPASFDMSWDVKTGYKTKQLLAAPIRFENNRMGVVQLLNKVYGNNFTLEDQRSVIEIAKVLGIAFYNHQRLRQQAKNTKFDYLISNNIITQKDLEQAMVLARKVKSSFENILMADYYVSKEDIGMSLSSFYNTRFISYDERMAIPTHLIKGLKATYA